LLGDLHGLRLCRRARGPDPGAPRIAPCRGHALSARLGLGFLIRVEESIEIARSPEAVWAFVADPANDPRWCRKVKFVEPAGVRRWRVLHKPVALRPPIELILEHLELRPAERLALREEDEASIVEVEYRLEPRGAGTRFTQISDFEWKTPPRVLHRAFAHGVRRDVRRQVRALKRLLES
jgi:hypothetical protein